MSAFLVLFSSFLSQLYLQVFHSLFMTNPNSHQFVLFPHYNQIQNLFVSLVSKPFPGNRTHCLQSTHSFHILLAQSLSVCFEHIDSEIASKEFCPKFGSINIPFVLIHYVCCFMYCIFFLSIIKM